MTKRKSQVPTRKRAITKLPNGDRLIRDRRNPPTVPPMFNTILSNKNKRIDELEQELGIAQSTEAHLRASELSAITRMKAAQEAYRSLRDSREAIAAKPSFLWTTGQGQKVAPADMTEEHLRNTISYCSRTLLSKLGNAVWLNSPTDKPGNVYVSSTGVERLVEGLHYCLAEAKKRKIRV